MRKILSLLFLLFVVLSAPAQLVISGTVTDTAGTPVPYASIIARDCAAIADADGRFTIDLKSGHETISVSSVSYRTATLRAAGSTLQVRLEKSGELETVVVQSIQCCRRHTVCGICTSYMSRRLHQSSANSESTIQASCYPNPTRGDITLIAGAPVREGFIIDMGGRKLQHFAGSDKTAPVFIQLGGYPAGTYFVRYFVSSRGWATEKVVLIR